MAIFNGASKVLGLAGNLIYTVLNDSKVEPQGESDWDNEMPGFEFLSDAEIAKVLTYVRSNLGNSGNAITETGVADRRAH